MSDDVYDEVIIYKSLPARRR